VCPHFDLAIATQPGSIERDSLVGLEMINEVRSTRVRFALMRPGGTFSLPPPEPAMSVKVLFGCMTVRFSDKAERSSGTTVDILIVP